MPGLFSQLLEILCLRSTIPFAKWMDVVDVADNDPCLTGKLASGQTLEKSSAREPAVDIRHPGWDVLTELELASAFGDFDGAQLPRPVIDILKEVAMDGTKMGQVEWADRHAFSDSVAHQTTLNSIKLAGVANAEAITKDVGLRIDVRIDVSAHFASAAARACARI